MKRSNTLHFAVAALFSVLGSAFVASEAGAAFVTGKLDLTTAGALGAFDAHATFYQSSDEGAVTGTGRIDPFLRIQRDEVEQGYNTDWRKPSPPHTGSTQFDEDKAWTHSEALSDFKVENGRLDIYLDINQKASKPLLSLDQLQLFLTKDPNLTGYNTSNRNFGANAVKVWDMNPNCNTNNWVKLDYHLVGSGSGRADMEVKFDDALFRNPYVGYTGELYLVMYSKFGGHDEANDGFEEWYHYAAAVPEPETYALFLAGLGLLGVIARRRPAA